MSMLSSIIIKQSSSPHPAKLERNDLQILFKNVSRFENLPSNIGTLDGKNGGLVNRDAGILTISITFILTAAASALVSEVTQDVYKWAKERLFDFIDKKKKETLETKGSYQIKPPKWEIILTDGDDSKLKIQTFSIQINAASPVLFEEAFSRLEEELKTGDIDKSNYSWSATEKMGELEITHG